MSQPVIALTTDFGQADSYVGTMKGVILGICPQATLVDVCHEIRPQDLRQAAFVLRTAAPHFPPGTVHLTVVDPGVGSTRRPIVVQTERAIYVAPDNGVLSLALALDPARLAVHLTDRQFHLGQVSATFHGRDIFAPAAAHLACGADPHQMGERVPLSELVTLPSFRPQLQPDGSWRAEILHVDHFGNLLTNYELPMANPQDPRTGIEGTIEVGGERIEGLRRTFADVGRGELVAYMGSSGYLEIAVREGNAAARLDADAGDPVRVEGLPAGAVEGGA